MPSTQRATRRVSVVVVASIVVVVGDDADADAVTMRNEIVLMAEKDAAVIEPVVRGAAAVDPCAMAGPLSMSPAAAAAAAAAEERRDFRENELDIGLNLPQLAPTRNQITFYKEINRQK